MNIRADLDQSAHVSGSNLTYQPSPLAGVERVMLDRVGDEVAVATSLVRYAPKAYFDPHGHALGEEFIVLEGTFSDEHGDYPAGTYVRNPPGTSHKPFSEDGCLIWVKLRQFDEADQVQMSVDLVTLANEQPFNHLREVYTYQAEVASVVRVEASSRFAFDASFYVRELVVISGELTWQQDETRSFGPNSWLRMRPGEPLRINALSDCVVFTKTRPVYRPADV